MSEMSEASTIRPFLAGGGEMGARTRAFDWRLRTDPRLAGIRLIALTGYGLETDRQRSKNAGFEAHMVKPVDLERLNSVLLQDSAVASGGREPA
jgi:CheY-like chemotaxis protein